MPENVARITLYDYYSENGKRKEECMDKVD